MDGRTTKNCGQLISPGRAKVWTEKSPKHHHYDWQKQQQQQQPNRKVPVVYYLCRNRQMEHPHFMEVPLSSPDGLLLRDVTERLNALRGRGIATKYSWSCKRSYNSSYVWHDLGEEDLILPVHDNEYVLKGSELIGEPEPISYSGAASPAAAGTISAHKKKAAAQETRSRDESTSSSYLTVRTGRSDYLSPPPDHRPPFSAAASPDVVKNHCSPRFANAATQTDYRSVEDQSQICLGSGDALLKIKQQTPEMCRDFVSPSLSPGSDAFPSHRSTTLESLIRADINNIKTVRRSIQSEGGRTTMHSMKLKPSNLIMQLISCGSIYVKDHNFDLIPTYKHSFTNSKFSSPSFSTSFRVGEFDCLKDEGKEYLSPSLRGTKIIKDHQSSSFERRNMNFDSVKASTNEKQRCDSMRLVPTKEPKMSSWRAQSSRYASINSSETITGASLYKKQERNVIKIEQS